MKKLLSACMIFIFFSSFSVELEYKLLESDMQAKFEQDDYDDFPDKVLISLGFSCSVSRKLRDDNLRCFAFPFDWIRSSFKGVCDLFENDFSDFLNPEYLSFEKSYILNHKYAIAFYHDFPLAEDFLASIEKISEKYKRRIDRLYRAMNSNRTIYLFRFSVSLQPCDLDMLQQTKAEIEKLRDILHKKFPKCNFTLVAMGNDDSYKIDWQMSYVKNFYLEDHSSSKEWSTIFKDLGLL